MASSRISEERRKRSAVALSLLQDSPSRRLNTTLHSLFPPSRLRFAWSLRALVLHGETRRIRHAVARPKAMSPGCFPSPSLVGLCRWRRLPCPPIITRRVLGNLVGGLNSQRLHMTNVNGGRALLDGSPKQQSRSRLTLSEYSCLLQLFQLASAPHNLPKTCSLMGASAV